MSDNWTSWGKQPNSAMRHQYDQNICPHCDCHEDRLFFYEYIVGFSDKPDDRWSMYENDRAGMAVKECPKCFATFTSHVHGPEMRIINQNMARDENFLKVPGAKEAFLKMLKEVKAE